MMHFNIHLWEKDKIHEQEGTEFQRKSQKSHKEIESKQNSSFQNFINKDNQQAQSVSKLKRTTKF